MKKLLLMCWFFLILPPVFAQQTWLQGSVTGENKALLPYANIGISGTSTGTVSRPDGMFQLLLPAEISKTDTLQVSYLGYETFKLPVLEISRQNPEKLLVNLKPKPLELMPVEIKAARLKPKTYGSKRENTVLNTNYAISGQPFQNLGAAMGKPFNLKGKAHFLKKLNVYFMYNTFDTAVFRVNVYCFKNGKPEKLLNRENMYWTLVKHRKGWATFDLTAYNLVTDQKILVSLEWVAHSKRGNVMGVPLAMPIPGAVHYYKFGSQANWKVYQAMSTSINLETEREE